MGCDVPSRSLAPRRWESQSDVRVSASGRGLSLPGAQLESRPESGAAASLRGAPQGISGGHSAPPPGPDFGRSVGGAGDRQRSLWAVIVPRVHQLVLCRRVRTQSHFSASLAAGPRPQLRVPPSVWEPLGAFCPLWQGQATAWGPHPDSSESQTGRQRKKKPSSSDFFQFSDSFCLNICFSIKSPAAWN